MSARRKSVISTEEIQFNHKPVKMLLTQKKGVGQNGQTPSIFGICSYCVLDGPVFERCQTLLHPELTPWWSFLLADGAHHKKPHSPTHPQRAIERGKGITHLVIKSNGLSGDSGQRGPYNPCNHSLYIAIIIFPHIDNPQSTIYFKKKDIKKETQKSEGTH